jgi:hypothetical protein
LLLLVRLVLNSAPGFLIAYATVGGITISAGGIAVRRFTSGLWADYEAVKRIVSREQIMEKPIVSSSIVLRACGRQLHQAVALLPCMQVRP